MSPDEFIAELWSYAQEVPMAQHPWFQGILQHRWTRGQLILGEVQHYLRVRTNPIFFGYIAVNAVAEKQYELMEVVLENFTEELAGPRSHVDIMLQFLEEGGISREEADCAEPAPGTMAAIEMIVGGCQRRSALEGLALLSFTESQHGGPDRVAAQVYRELIGYYGFSERAAETYQLHAEQDVGALVRESRLPRTGQRPVPPKDSIRILKMVAQPARLCAPEWGLFQRPATSANQPEAVAATPDTPGCHRTPAADGSAYRGALAAPYSVHSRPYPWSPRSWRLNC